MNGREKSDSAEGAVKPANKTGMPAAEQVERRAGTEGNAIPQSTSRTQGRPDASQARDRIRVAARRNKKEKFTALLHHATPEALRDAFYAIAKNAAAGIDGITWRDYEADFERKLADLHDRVQSGAYRATPSRRVYIPKPDGGQRPLAVAALEDKIVQRAVVDVLNAIYEEDFLGFSYGFRPGRGAHDALDALSAAIYARGELHCRRRHCEVLRLGEQRMARPVPRTSHRRQARSPPDPEMASGGRSRRRTDRGS